jgi:hypothetical protein
LSSSFTSLKPLTGSRFYLFLDQFERVVVPYEQYSCGDQQFEAMLTRLMQMTPKWMTIVYIARLEGEILIPALKTIGVLDSWESLKTHDTFIDEVVDKLAKKAGISIEPETTNRLKDKFSKRKQGDPFTLAHVNAVCHLMCESGDLSLSALEDILERYQEILNRIINQNDVIDFIEDIPFDEAARVLFLRMLKVISREGFQNFAECLFDHFKELFPGLANSKE